MLNDKIKDLRKAAGISQIELAHALGVSKQCVSNWENDNVQPSIEMLVKLAAYFKVSTDCMLGLETKNYIDATGLTESETAHIVLLIKDLQSNS